jgi:RNase H-like domain found in reverse transcriptase
MIEACLSQIGDDEKLHSIAFYFRKLSLVELNYNIYDKKLLVIVAAFQK